VKIKNILPVRHLKNKSKLKILTGLSFALLLPQAHSDEFTTKATLTGGIEYNSNPAMTNAQKNPVWIYSFVPNLFLEDKNEINDWYLDGSLSVQRHSDQKVLVDRNDPSLAVGWNHTYESGLFGIKASYMESSSYLAQITSTGEFSQINNTQKDQILAAKWQQTINSKWSVLTNASYRDTTYSEFMPNSLVNYNYEDVDPKLIYSNNEKLDTFVQVGYAHMDPSANLASTDKTRLMLGADYKVNENLKLNASAGVYNLSGRESDTDWEGGVLVDYTAERIHYNAGLSKGVAPSGLGGFQTSDSFKLGLVYDRTEFDRFGANYSYDRYIKNTSIFGLDGVDYQQASAFYERDLSNHWKARLTASYRRLDATSSSNGNLIGATLSYDTLSF